MPEKVLFLDVDGVLNTSSLISKEGVFAVGEVFLNRLATIVYETNVELVLSSSWRLFPDHKRILQERFESRKLKWIDTTKENANWVPRSDEICEWLKRHPEIKKFAIVDDDRQAGKHTPTCFFMTTFKEGLTEEIMKNIISHFNEDN